MMQKSYTSNTTEMNLPKVFRHEQKHCHQLEHKCCIQKNCCRQPATLVNTTKKFNCCKDWSPHSPRLSILKELIKLTPRRIWLNKTDFNIDQIVWIAICRRGSWHGSWKAFICIASWKYFWNFIDRNF